MFRKLIIDLLVGGGEGADDETNPDIFSKRSPRCLKNESLLGDMSVKKRVGPKYYWIILSKYVNQAIVEIQKGMLCEI